jgi:predicted amidophosphoribosyltransferase
MPRKKPVEKKVEEVVEEVVEEEQEEVTCPVCGKPVGLDVFTCPYCGAEFEEEEIEEVVEEEQEEVTCPVCGKPVGLDVSTCPYCGAEFEVEEVEEIVEEAAEENPEEAAEAEEVIEEETAECPVCGKMVSLMVSSCPNCGAEFEEEEIEEVIEVVEPEEVPVARPQARAVQPVEEIEEELDEILVEAQEEAAVAVVGPPTSITDLRVIGISLIILGILGSQISFMIDWYWTWVPPIGDNLVLFVLAPVVVILVGLGVFMLMKRRGASKRRKAPSMLPGVALSLFLFGIFALIMVMLWNPINAALQDSNLGVGGAFVAMLIFGALAVFMGSKTATPKGSY